MNTDYIAEQYGYLAEGDVVGGQVCPDCGGGRSKERSLRVSRFHGRLVAKCYRATCGWRYNGRPSAFVHTADVQVPKELQAFPVVNPRPLSDKEKDELSAKFSIEQGMLDWANWSHVDDFKPKDYWMGPRFVLPIIGPDGRIRGKTFRSWQGHLPKSLINKIADEEQICWYKPRPYGKVLVVVEDQPSALRLAAAGVDALALCGTVLNDARMAEIKKQGHEKVWLCLDQDATALAVRFVASYKMRFSKLLLKLLDKDVKNMTDEEFRVFVEEVL